MLPYRIIRLYYGNVYCYYYAVVVVIFSDHIYYCIVVYNYAQNCQQFVYSKKKKKSRFLAQSKATYTALEVHKITLMTVMSLNA